METKHPAEGSFGSEFLSISNHCEVMAAWRRKTLKKLFFCVFRKNDPYGKFFKINSVPKEWSTCCVQISWNLADGKSVKSCVTYVKKFAWLSSSRYCADHTQNLPGPTPDNVLRLLQGALENESNIRIKPSLEPNNDRFHNVGDGKSNSWN